MDGVVLHKNQGGRKMELNGINSSTYTAATYVATPASSASKTNSAVSASDNGVV